MFGSVSKLTFLLDLRHRIQAHCDRVTDEFLMLDEAQLTWQPNGREWSIGQCVDHLNLTHDYYAPKIGRVLTDAPTAPRQGDSYRASFWGGVYLYFAVNPKYSFPAPDQLAPAATHGRDALHAFLERQTALRETLRRVESLDLVRTRIPLEGRIHFNLGDCLKVLVYHDQLHLRQAQGVWAHYQETMARTTDR